MRDLHSLKTPIRDEGFGTGGEVQFAKSLAVGEGFPRLFEKYAFFPNPSWGFQTCVKLKAILAKSLAPDEVFYHFAPGRAPARAIPHLPI